MAHNARNRRDNACAFERKLSTSERTFLPRDDGFCHFDLYRGLSSSCFAAATARRERALPVRDVLSELEPRPRFIEFRLRCRDVDHEGGGIHLEQEMPLLDALAGDDVDRSDGRCNLVGYGDTRARPHDAGELQVQGLAGKSSLRK